MAANRVEGDSKDAPAFMAIKIWKIFLSGYQSPMLQPQARRVHIRDASEAAPVRNFAHIQAHNPYV